MDKQQRREKIENEIRRDHSLHAAYVIAHNQNIDGERYDYERFLEIAVLSLIKQKRSLESMLKDELNNSTRPPRLER